MLYTETVAGSTLELLKKLEAENAMSDFNLAGGTSLALYLDHRINWTWTFSRRNLLMLQNWKHFSGINIQTQMGAIILSPPHTLEICSN